MPQGCSKKIEFHLLATDLAFQLGDARQCRRQDPRGAPDPAPLWMVLDATPEGRGGDWYPKLDYSA